MRKLIILTAVVLASCGQTEFQMERDKRNKLTEVGEYRIVVIDSCEYLVRAPVGDNNHVITHKGNCKYCIKRNN